MNLNFSPPRTISENGITQVIRDAWATPEFWAKWRYNKDAMSQLGICVIPYNDDNGKKRWIVRKLAGLSSGEEKPVTVPPVPVTDTTKLLPFQVPAVSALMGSLISNNVAIDASDTGTGKTYVSLKVCRLMGYRPGIVCMRNSIPEWKKVCKYMGVTPLFIYNWESCIGRFFKNYGKIHKITQPPNPYIKMGIHEWKGTAVYKWVIPPRRDIVLIFDEAHKATGNGSHNQKIVMAAKDYPVMALSATLADKVERFKTFGERLGLYAKGCFDNWMHLQGCFIDNHNRWTAINERQAMLELSRKIFPNFGVRVRKSDLPDFPEVQNIARLFQTKNVDRQNKQYQKLLTEIERLKNANEEMTALTLILRHRQIAELNKVDLLVDLAKEYIDNNMSVVIFVNFTDTLKRIAKLLKTSCVIHGEQDGATRQKNIEAFQADKERILIANTQAGGISINLHDLNGTHARIALIAPTYDARQLVQVMGRIHRAGAKSKAINMLVYAAGTIEEKVFKSVSQKISNINTLNDGDLAETDVFRKE